MNLFKRCVLAVLLGCFVFPEVAADADVKKAIVKVYTVYSEYDYYDPWQMRGQNMRNGSGSIIEGKRILTNAHVVGDETFIQVKRAGQAKKYVAKVEIVAHESDLAILKVQDDSFFDDVIPLKIGSLPEVRDKVVVYGFPMGGDELSITEGVVSRVEHQRYTHSKAHLLACQIDAAINPGNSGGPVVDERGQIVGIAFQGGGGDNIGYMVPAPIVKHFLKDITDGKYDGIPSLGISVQELDNMDIRDKYKMKESQTGILINKVYPGSPADKILKSGDIILAIDSKNIENDATVEFRENERTFFSYVIQEKYIDDVIKCDILRSGKTISVKVKLFKPENPLRLVPHDSYDVAPVYYILGGFVFEPLTLNLLKEWGSGWYDNAPVNLVNYYYWGEPTKEQKEVVVLVKVLADEVNMGYQDWKHKVIASVNGRKIGSMEDLITAFESTKGKFYTIEDIYGYKIILEKEKVDNNNLKILKKYKINSRVSNNLQSRLSQ